MWSQSSRVGLSSHMSRATFNTMDSSVICRMDMVVYIGMILFSLTARSCGSEPLPLVRPQELVQMWTDALATQIALGASYRQNIIHVRTWHKNRSASVVAPQGATLFLLSAGVRCGRLSYKVRPFAFNREVHWQQELYTGPFSIRNSSMKAHKIQ